MHAVCPSLLVAALGVLGSTTTTTAAAAAAGDRQMPVLPYASDRHVSTALFEELEELARIVDIAYCVGVARPGISKPFTCLSRCSDFPSFELVKTWDTPAFVGDSCGYIALDHGQQRIIVAFRGTHSFSNTVVDLSTAPQQYEPFPGSTTDGEPPCLNCTVHAGFQYAWQQTHDAIIRDVEEQRQLYVAYQLHLTGHSLGGAVAALAGLDFLARGWDPIVTTYGGPRLGNVGLAQYVDRRFNLTTHGDGDGQDGAKYRRVTRVDDPVPLLPLREWGYVSHAGEIFISTTSMPPHVEDVRRCDGDADLSCSSGQDTGIGRRDSPQRDLLLSVAQEIRDLLHEPWGIPTRYRLWNLLDAHRQYFVDLGLCVPGGFWPNQHRDGL